jgi:hypothetical protein
MTIQLTLEEERILGTLCEKGLVKERFDFFKNDLVKEITPLGFAHIKQLLKDPFYRSKFIEMAKNEIN